MLKTVIVEDDRMVAAINAQFAEKTPGVQVVATFHNGRDALAFLEQTSVDLVLTDLYMPEMSGIELVEELRRRGCNAEVIFITAANDAPHIQDAGGWLGCHVYLMQDGSYSVTYDYNAENASVEGEKGTYEIGADGTLTLTAEDGTVHTAAAAANADGTISYTLEFTEANTSVVCNPTGKR